MFFFPNCLCHICHVMDPWIYLSNHLNAHMINALSKLLTFMSWICEILFSNELLQFLVPISEGYGSVIIIMITFFFFYLPEIKIETYTSECFQVSPEEPKLIFPFCLWGCQRCWWSRWGRVVIKHHFIAFLWQKLHIRKRSTHLVC